MAPGPGVPDQGAPGGVEIVQVAGAVLGHAEGPELREEEVHLGRGFGVRRDLEDNVHAVDGQAGPRGRDAFGRRDQGDLTGGDRLAEARVHMAAWSLGQGGAIHVGRSSAHDIAQQDVFADRLGQEAFRRDDPQTVADVLVRQDALDPAIVVHVAVGVDHCGHRLVAAMGAHQGQRRPGGFLRDQGIDDDIAGLALDEGDVGNVEVADLIDAGRHLEQTMDGVQPGLTPEAGIDGVRALSLQEVKGFEAPDGIAGRAGDGCVGQGPNETPPGVDEILTVIHWQDMRQGRVGGAGERRRILLLLL